GAVEGRELDRQRLRPRERSHRDPDPRTGVGRGAGGRPAAAPAPALSRWHHRAQRKGAGREARTFFNDLRSADQPTGRNRTVSARAVPPAWLMRTKLSGVSM